jgi:hypothetical protein
MGATDIITLQEAKDFLNITSSNYDTELPLFVSAASQMWVRRVGPVAGSVSYDEWYSGGRPTIVLRHTPVQSVTAVTEALNTSLAYTLTAEVLDGQTGGDAYGYTIDKDLGLLVRRMNGIAANFAPGINNVRVTYVAGFATTPEDIKIAVKVLTKRLWDSQRGGTTRPGQAPEAPAPMRLWPPMAEDIAMTYLVPGIA